MPNPDHSETCLTCGVSARIAVDKLAAERTYAESLAQALAERDAARMDVGNIRSALADLLDAHAQQGAVTWSKALDRACVLAGRHCEPFLSLVQPRYGTGPSVGDDPVEVANRWKGDGRRREPDWDLNPEDTASFLASAVIMGAAERDALRAECERMRPAYEAAKVWREAVRGRPAAFKRGVVVGLADALVDAIDTALTAETKESK